VTASDREMLQQIFEAALRIDCPHIDFLDGISDAVSAVARAVSVTQSRGLRHHNAHKLCADRRGRKLEGRGPTAAVGRLR
jgi:hypothetical protein